MDLYCSPISEGVQHRVNFCYINFIGDPVDHTKLC